MAGAESPLVSQSSQQAMSDLPKGWVRRESKSRPGTIYYFNSETGESVWDKPTGDGEGGESQVRVLHLLKKHRDSRRPSSWRQEHITSTKEEATTQLRALRDEIVAAGPGLRQKFEELAMVESDCSSASRGGDLGTFGRGQMQKPFEETSFGLKVGELSDIVSTDSGVHIILRIA